MSSDTLLHIRYTGLAEISSEESTSTAGSAFRYTLSKETHKTFQSSSRHLVLQQKQKLKKEVKGEKKNENEFSMAPVVVKRNNYY